MSTRLNKEIRETTLAFREEVPKEVVKNVNK